MAGLESGCGTTLSKLLKFISLSFKTRWAAALAAALVFLSLSFFWVSSSDHDFTLPKTLTNFAHDPYGIHNTTDRPLILYVYSEAEHARTNIKFFIKHALHGSADFVFIFNGPTIDPATGQDDIQWLVPNKTNIRYVRRANDCFDLGAYAEVLTTADLYKSYKRFIMMNASVRGPFIPHWSNACWSERYLAKLDAHTKLVGMTMNCWPTAHVQSMLWATDSTGLSQLLFPQRATPNRRKWISELRHLASVDDLPDGPLPPEGINQCFHDYNSAVEAEVGAAPIILAAGYKVDVMLQKFQADEEYMIKCEGKANMDPMMEKGYDGANVQPYETIFMKTNRFIDPILIENLSRWTDQAKYSSWDVC